jgi:nucleoside-diphosphate-sugar epimerase
MRALVTGATGKVGHATARTLIAEGHDVRALVRDPERARGAVPDGAELAQGDVTDPASLVRAARGCELVFNAMGLPEQWLADPGAFQRVNVEGTRAVVEAARAAGAGRLVHTSTIDVFHAERNESFDESVVADYPKGTAYERSKQEAERVALAGGDAGLEVVVVNPAAVYGPGPAGSASVEHDLFRPVLSGRLPVMTPGGFGVAFSEGVGRGQVLAALKGRPGERYILCDGHVSLADFARTAVDVAGRGRVPPTVPAAAARAIAIGGEGLSRVIRRPPLLPRGQLHFFLWNAAPRSDKAQRELGWRPTELRDGVRRTLEAHGLLADS